MRLKREAALNLRGSEDREAVLEAFADSDAEIDDVVAGDRVLFCRVEPSIFRHGDDSLFYPPEIGDVLELRSTEVVRDGDPVDHEYALIDFDDRPPARITSSQLLAIVEEDDV